MSDGHVRIRDWEEFKRLVSEKKPKSLVFILEQNALSPNKELTTLRIILLHQARYYIFLDFPKGQFLRETKIPLRKDKKGLWNLDEDEVKNILKKEFEKDNLENIFFLDNLTKLVKCPFYRICL
jgi:hypothetical protein